MPQSDKLQKAKVPRCQVRSLPGLYRRHDLGGVYSLANSTSRKQGYHTLFNPLDTTTKPRVDPSWRVLRSMRAYDKYLTGRNDIVRVENDHFVHIGNIAFGMSHRIWLHTLCGITYAVHPDPLTSTLRHDAVILQRHPPGAARCVYCEECKPSEDEANRLGER